jgi:hypothetical protein
LALFVELDPIPRRRRHEDLELRAKERALHDILGLLDQWFCSGCSVFDRSPGPVHGPQYVAHDAWFRVRAVREALLEAIATERAGVS